MGCGSCGGGNRVMAVVDASGQQKPVYVSKTSYVWQWIAADGSDSKVFGREDEAREFMKSGNPGTLQITSSAS